MNLGGRDLARRFWADVVGPLLAARFAQVRYAAGRLGSGSDVLGLDDATSRDHDWGCRLTVLLDAADGGLVPAVSHLLGEELPDSFLGRPVRFATTWDPIPTHQVEVNTVHAFARSRLGTDPSNGLSAPDWLCLTGHSVLEVVGGPVFVDTTRELAPLRELLRWYPPDVERYVLAAAWDRLAQRMPWIGRTAERDQPLQSRLLSAAIATDIIRLAFLLRRRWAPYPKWTELAFRDVPGSAELQPAIEQLTTADGWREREAGAVAALDRLGQWQRALGRPTPAEVTEPFFDRPYRTVRSEVAAMLLADISDPAVRALPPGVGAIEQWVENAVILSSPELRSGALAAYRGWLGRA